MLRGILVRHMIFLLRFIFTVRLGIFTQEKRKKKIIYIVNVNHVHKVHNGCISQVENCPVTRMVDLGKERYQCTVFFVKRHLHKKYVDYKLYCFNYDKLHAKRLFSFLLASYTETVWFECNS